MENVSKLFVRACLDLSTTNYRFLNKKSERQLKWMITEEEKPLHNIKPGQERSGGGRHITAKVYNEEMPS